MSIEKIIVKERNITGKEESGRIRREGFVPAVVYGLKKGSVPITVSPKVISGVLQSEKGINSLLELQLENSDKTAFVMIRDLTVHPITDRLQHVDFQRIDVDQKVEKDVPVFYTGSPEGVKLGGILQVIRHQILVSCLPKDLPGKLEFDVSHLNLDESLRVSDVTVPDGIEILLEGKRVLAVVHEHEVEAVEETDEDEIEEVAEEATEE